MPAKRAPINTEAMLALLDQGLPKLRVAAMFGVSTRTVRNRLRERGLPVNPPNRKGSGSHNRPAYFHAYYLAHREEILAKNRAWAAEHPDRRRELARLRRAGRRPEPRFCADCGAPVARALRCRRCTIRHRYATDADFRRRRLVTTKAWRDRGAPARLNPDDLERLVATLPLERWEQALAAVYPRQPKDAQDAH